MAYFIPFLGQFLLYISAFLSLVLCFKDWKKIYTFLFSVLGFLFLVLLYAHVTDDFSVMNVVRYSHTEKPFLYKLTPWANYEGSMLFFTLYLSLFSLYFKGKNTVLGYRICGLILTAFLIFIILWSNPFETVASIPKNGLDLNPLLQDPSLMIHPPILYAGYTSLLIPFALSLEKVINPSIPIKSIHKSSLFSFALITLGIGLGSFWAYYELGWGGFWFWDPVENLSLLTWFTLSLSTHTYLKIKRTNTNDSVYLKFSTLPFLSILLSLFFIRSGFVSSVHSFAVDPEKGGALGIIFVLFCILSAMIFYKAQKPQSHKNSRLLELKGWLDSFILCFLVLTLLIPVLGQLMGKTFLLKEDFFNIYLTPVMLIFSSLIMGVFKVILWPWIITFIMLSLSAFFGLDTTILPSMGIGLGFILILYHVKILLRKKIVKKGVFLSHLGLSFVVLGISLSQGLSLKESALLKVGESKMVGGYPLIFKKVDFYKRHNFEAQKATLNWKGKVLMPEKHHYWTQNMIHHESSLKSTFFHHAYALMGETFDHKGVKYTQFEIQWKPFINLLWFGCLLMVLGITLSIRRGLKV